ncbi:hypothetical protein ACFXDJ_04000 [Streptomyces sp. NPDC059443]|uniref:hypothetical protein n=1 Tax=unclassified Streptomyces TaxID=2593676 RepID=UPI00369678CE
MLADQPASLAKDFGGREGYLAGGRLRVDEDLRQLNGGGVGVELEASAPEVFVHGQQGQCEPLVEGEGRGRRPGGGDSRSVCDRGYQNRFRRPALMSSSRWSLASRARFSI